MSSNRREFIRHSLVVLGAAVAGGAGSSSSTSSSKNPESTGSSCCGGSNARPTSPVSHTEVLMMAASVTSAKAEEEERDAARTGIPGRKWVMVIDLSKCDGCGHCISGCSKMHFIPPDRQYIKVLRLRDSLETSPYYFPQPCFQCDNPPCTKVCPVDATFKRQDGPVLVDNERCIGCRFCMAACPYSIRTFNWARPDAPDEEPSDAATHPYSPERGYPRRVGTVEKCDFCPDMAAQGKLPACASSCPMGVIYYGDQNEDAVTNGQGLTVRLSQLLRDGAAYRHLEHLGTEPRVFYLPPKDRMYPAFDQ